MLRRPWRLASLRASADRTELRTAPKLISVEKPKQQHKRHIRKYAEVTLTDERSFYFRGPEGKLFGKYHCADWNAPGRTVIGGDNNGAYGVADPRPDMARERGDHYLTGGHYGVVPWANPAGAVSASACHDNGPWSVADPRVCDSVQAEGFSMPAPADKLVARIRALDGTWHRPFTTLELAALQSLLDPEDSWVPWRLDGESDQAWRERIGNAVPSAAAQAIAHVMGETLLLAMTGETFRLSAQPVWVRPLAIAISVRGAA